MEFVAAAPPVLEGDRILLTPDSSKPAPPVLEGDAILLTPDSAVAESPLSTPPHSAPPTPQLDAHIFKCTSNSSSGVKRKRSDNPHSLAEMADMERETALLSAFAPDSTPMPSLPPIVSRTEGGKAGGMRDLAAEVGACVKGSAGLVSALLHRKVGRALPVVFAILLFATPRLYGWLSGGDGETELAPDRSADVVIDDLVGIVWRGATPML